LINHHHHHSSLIITSGCSECVQW